jgi:hypothetical protein
LHPVVLSSMDAAISMLAARALASASVSVNSTATDRRFIERKLLSIRCFLIAHQSERRLIHINT